MKSLVGRRRRVDDEGEEDEGPTFMADSQSEGSTATRPAEDVANAADGEEGQAEQVSAAEATSKGSADAATSDKSKKARRPRKKTGQRGDTTADPTPEQVRTSFKAMADTEAMMNGREMKDEGQDVVEFDPPRQGGQETSQRAALASGNSTTTAERQRREHEEYRRRRDADPAFIPNRGNFFMHDTRSSGQTIHPRGAWAGRGRGRAGVHPALPLPPTSQVPPFERPAEQQWKHDLHSTVNDDARTQSSFPARPVGIPQDQIDSARLFPKPAVATQAQHATISFSSTKLVGQVQIRVVLSGMKSPISFSAVPWKHYIRLPDHRPPLRRDKPVRVSLPNHPQRYIFPSTERSFIFIPRQMRPNQQRFGHNSYQRSIGGYGYSSRRTSMYGGSVYSASIAASRRSSLAGANRERAFSPAGSYAPMSQSRPVVRLPQSAQHSSLSTPVGPLSGMHTPTGMPQLYNVPPPQAPVYQGTPTTTMHQPRPRKTISVTGIESPAVLEQAASEPQPFANQLPAHMNEPPPPPLPPQPYFSPHLQYPHAHMQPAQAGTPLSGIPEQAIHAPAFQPPPYGHPGHYPPYPPHQQNYYHPPPAPNGYPPMPMYPMPSQGYMGAPYQHPQAAPPALPPSQPMEEELQGRYQHSQSQSQSQSQSGMVAHESNGMVFYTSATEAQGQPENYQPAESFVPSYAMPGLPPPTPAPENHMSYYYGQPHDGMQELGPSVYYPAQPPQ